MKKIYWSGLGVLACLAVLVIAYSFSAQTPSLAKIRAAPEKFRMEDYPDKVILHTRLSTLFPRGTNRADIDTFFNKAAIKGKQNDGAQCTYSVDYETVRMVYDLNLNQLQSVHIVNDGTLWPPFREHCRASHELTPAQGSSAEQPIHLPMLPLEIEP